MRVTALILALIGGSIGILFGVLALAIGSAANAAELGSAHEVIGLAISAIAAAGVGIACAGAYFAGWRRTLMSWGILVAAFWHLISISLFGVFAFTLLLLAAIFAWLGRNEGDGTGSLECQLAELHRLRDDGMITGDEYTNRRTALLSRL